MQRHILFFTGFEIATAMAQGNTANPLNNFISAAQGGAGAINSALSTQSTPTSSPSSSSSTTPSAAPATSSPAAHHGLSSGAKTGIIVGVVLGVLILVGLLIGIWCCLRLRKRRRRRRAVIPQTTEEVAQNPSAPLVAGDTHHHGHGQVPSLSQHPAMRQSSNENPFTDSAHASIDPPRYSHHSNRAGLAGAAATKATAGYGLGHHRKSNEQQQCMSEMNNPLTVQRGHDPVTTGGASMDHTKPQHRSSGEHHPMSSSTHAQGMHHGLPPAIAAGVTAGAMGRRSRDHHRSSEHIPISDTTHAQGMLQGLPPAAIPNSHHSQESYPNAASAQGTHQGRYSANSSHTQELSPASNTIPQPPRTDRLYIRDESPVGYNNQNGGSHDGLRILPSANHAPPRVPKETLAGGAALAALQSEEKRRRRESSGSRSRSRSSRRRSSGLPTHTNNGRPPTPFGLSAIGQPYDDKHVSVLQSEPPSQDLQHSLNNREEPFASDAIGNYDYQATYHMRGHSTPPQVPSRSPNRENRASMVVQSSYESSLDNTTSSNSAESYLAANDPYKPANPNRSYIPPWERHQTRYSMTPPGSAGIAPPAVPWDNNDTPSQRRHSPRTSIDASSRRSSRSPATGINGQPRRLRFEDLQTGEGGHTHAASGSPQGYDGYEASCWSPNVGKAL